MMSDLPMYPPIHFEDKYEQWTLTFTEDAVQMTKSKKGEAGAAPLYEQTILRRQIRKIYDCHHTIGGGGGTLYTMLRLIIGLEWGSYGDPREVEPREVPELDPRNSRPLGTTYTDHGCQQHEMHMDETTFHIRKKIPTGDRCQVCIFQDYVISDLDAEELGCSGTDYWRSKEEDDMIVEKFNKMVSSLRSWSHTDYGD
jgi:hypothetical protein